MQYAFPDLSLISTPFVKYFFLDICHKIKKIAISSIMVHTSDTKYVFFFLCSAYNILRASSAAILSLMYLLARSGISDLSDKQTPLEALSGVLTRLHLDVSDAAAGVVMRGATACVGGLGVCLCLCVCSTVSHDLLSHSPIVHSLFLPFSLQVCSLIAPPRSCLECWSKCIGSHRPSDDFKLGGLR